MSTDDIKRKIAALLAKAGGTDHVHEAEVFMAKVSELLERHQIEMHEIRAQGGDKDPLTRVEDYVTRSHEWPSRLAFALGEYYGCKVLRWKAGSQYLLRTMGRASSCATFQVMLPFIISQVRQQARMMARDYRITAAKAERAVGMALIDRVYRLVPQQEKRRAENTANALVPVTDVQAYVDSLYPKVKAAKNLGGYYAEADEYAEKVSLNHQTTAVGRKQLAAG